MLTKLLKFIFFFLVVRPVVAIVLGLNVRNRQLLPTKGPAIIIANHNSHLDTMVLMTLFSWSVLPEVRPVAAADYFLKTKMMAWFSTKVIGILPLDRAKTSPPQTIDQRLSGVYTALEQNQIVILFPEGSRGEPEHLSEFKAGISHIAKAKPQVPIVPVYLHGLGKALPKGEALLVPFFCDVFIGEAFLWTGDKAGFMLTLQERMAMLAAQGNFPVWE